MKGRLIVLEGIDGTGKSTQARLLAEWLEAAGHMVVLSREPTQGPAGRAIRLAASNERLSPAEELELFQLDRRQHVSEAIAPALAAGKVVILDRYYFSTMAYQGACGIDPAGIRAENESFAPIPDLVIVLDLQVENALDRIQRRGPNDHFETLAQLTRCRDIFLGLAGEPSVRIISADDSRQAIQELIRNEACGIF